MFLAASILAVKQKESYLITKWYYRIVDIVIPDTYEHRTPLQENSWP